MNGRVRESIRLLREIASGDGKAAEAARLLGGLDELCAACEDLRRYHERDHAAQEEQYRLLAEGMRLFVLTGWPDGHADYLNRYFLDYAGMTAEQAAGRGWAGALHPEDAAAARRGWCRVARRERTAESFDVEARFRRAADGAFRWHLLRFVPVLRGDGGVRHWIATGIDIHDRKEAEAELERRRADEVRAEVLRRLVRVEEEERARISRDLHDQTGQHLTALRLGLERLRVRVREDADPEAAEADIRRLALVCDEITREVHQFAYSLRPTSLDDIGLAATLQNYVERWSAQYDIRADFHHSGLAGRRFDPLAETTVYRVVQEALTNVARHAAATRLAVLLECRGSSVRAIVEDDGRGFPVGDEEGAAAEGGERLGMIGMRERMRLAGGTMSVESAPGKGTTLYFRLPVSPRGEAGK